MRSGVPSIVQVEMGMWELTLYGIGNRGQRVLVPGGPLGRGYPCTLREFSVLAGFPLHHAHAQDPLAPMWGMS